MGHCILTAVSRELMSRPIGPVVTHKTTRMCVHTTPVRTEADTKKINVEYEASPEPSPPVVERRDSTLSSPRHTPFSPEYVPRSYGPLKRNSLASISNPSSPRSLPPLWNSR